MTTVTRSGNPIRTFFMFPAYTLAFVLPVAAVIGTYASISAYCDATASQLDSPRLCVGLQQVQSSMPKIPVLPKLPALGL